MKTFTQLLNIFILIITLFLNFSTLALAQQITQVLRGKVVDQLTGQPVADALILLQNNDQQVAQLVTDSNGSFRFPDLAIGRYDLVVHHLSYQDQVMNGLQLEAGKELVLRIELEESLQQLEEVVIERQNPVPELISGYSLTVEQSERLAATFYDPARMAASVPGVATSFDQANNIVVRGHSPASNQWWIEGLPVVSPNHLTNAGTFSDRPSLSGGGVSVLSAQVMANTRFMTGGYPVRYGNALGGIFEIGLRDGNQEKHEYTVQAGLLGIDAAAEGPLSGNGKSSFLVNYRYSTIGLVSALGVDVGEETINFQDLSFNLHWEGKSGSWNVFGLGGLSSETFEAVRDTAEWEGVEDVYDTRFRSNMGAAGIKHNLGISESLLIESGIAFSALTSNRQGFLVSPDFSRIQLEDDEIQRRILSWQSQLSWRFSSSQSLEAGITGTHYFDQLYQAFSALPAAPMLTTLDFDQAHLLLRPYLEWNWKLNASLEAATGLGFSYHDLADQAVAEPRLTLKWQQQGNSAALMYALVSQTQAPGTYFTRLNTGGQYQMPNLNLKLTRSHQLIANYSTMIRPGLKLKAETYYQELFDVPVAAGSENSFSVLNVMEEYVNQPLINEGSGRNYGLELSVEKYIADGFYLLGSGSLYEAKFTGSDGIERDSRFNGNYVFALSSGKEFYRQSKTRIWGINLRGIFQGGFHQAPIDLAASESAGYTVFDSGAGFSEQLDDYLRFDLRLSHTRHKSGYTRTWSLDIQNLTNQQNLAYRYYDSYLNEVVNKYQLGILPFLAYRVEF